MLFLVLEFVTNLSVGDCLGQCQYYGSGAGIRLTICVGVHSRSLLSQVALIALVLQRIRTSRSNVLYTTQQ